MKKKKEKAHLYGIILLRWKFKEHPEKKEGRMKHET